MVRGNNPHLTDCRDLEPAMSDHPHQPQNVYDNPEFLKGYSTLERFGAGWDKAAERADLLSLLPPLKGNRALDLGCGAGQLAQYLALEGAAEVIGVDISEQMLALARTQWAHPRVTYVRASMEQADFPPARFDLVVSLLALHYVQDYRRLVRRIGRWLVPGGVLVFSTEHPIYTSRLPDGGWVTDAVGKHVRWGIDRYFDEDVREEHWFTEGIRKAHRTFATFINGLLDAGFTVERVLEPLPSEQWFRDHSNSQDERRRPMFLMVRARKDEVL
jgi:2-polyprenyl-3-methyl-5-hydroxy-6-metoxy-1,4-benzoquinol methylase